MFNFHQWLIDQTVEQFVLGKQTWATTVKNIGDYVAGGLLTENDVPGICSRCFSEQESHESSFIGYDNIAFSD